MINRFCLAALVVILSPVVTSNFALAQAVPCTHPTLGPIECPIPPGGTAPIPPGTPLFPVAGGFVASFPVPPFSAFFPSSFMFVLFMMMPPAAVTSPMQQPTIQDQATLVFRPPGKEQTDLGLIKESEAAGLKASDPNLYETLRRFGYILDQDRNGLGSVPLEPTASVVPPSVQVAQATGTGEQPPETSADQTPAPTGEAQPTGEPPGSPVALGPEDGQTDEPLGPTTTGDRFPPPPLEKPPPPEEPPPPEKPPPPPQDPPREKLKPCCRLIGVDLFYPITSDPLKPPKMQEAFNEPAIGAYQVFLHDLSFFESATDLFVKSVGYPFAFTRHYRSNVETNKGGLLGHKWDFNYNKRIVPLAKRTTKNGLFIEQLGENIVALLYFNGEGRVDQYDVDVDKSDRVPRIVKNFGKTFKAYVTTYTSPPGAFHEIQRYVLTDDQPIVGDPYKGHPFGQHPNVEKFPDPYEPGVLFTERVFYVLRDKYGFRHIFNCRGQLIYSADRNENLMTFIYDAGRPLNPLTQNPVLISIIDTNNRSYTLEYENRGQDTLGTNFLCEYKFGPAEIPRLKSITDFDGRKVVFERQGGPDELVLEKVSWEPFGPNDLERGQTFETRYDYTGQYLLQTIKAPREVVVGGDPYLTVTWSSPTVSKIKLGGRFKGREAGGEFKLTPLGSGVEVEDRVGNKRQYQLKQVSDSMVISQITLTGANGDDKGPWTTKFLKHNDDYQVEELELPKKNRLRFEHDKIDEEVIQGEVRNKVPDQTYERNLSHGNLEKIIRVAKSRKEKDLVTRFEYDPLFNQVTKVTDPKEIETVYQYDNPFPNSFFDKKSGDNGNPKKIVLPTVSRPGDAGSLTGMTIESTYYVATGLLSSVKDSGGHVTNYTYDAGFKEGYLKSIELPLFGSYLSFENDSRGNVVRATDMGGAVTKFEVSKRDLVDRKIEDEKGFANATRYSYDQNGNLTKAVVDWKDNFDNPGGAKPGPESALKRRLSRTKEYDLLNQLIKVIEDAEGKDAVKVTTEFYYDGNGNMTVVKAPSPKDSGHVSTSYDYEGRDLVYRINRGAGEHIVQYGYDGNGNLEVVSDPRCPAGFIPAAARDATPSDTCPFTRQIFDHFDRLTKVVTVGGELEYLTIDRNGNPEEVAFTGITGANGGGKALLSKSGFRYDELNRMIEQRQYVLRMLDSRQGRIRPDLTSAVTTQWVYNKDGLVEKTLGPGKGETSFTYDALHRQDLVTDAEGNQTKHEYDKGGNLEVVREFDREPLVPDPPPTPMPGQFDGSKREFVTRWKYDALHRPVSRTDSGGHTRHMFYDSLGSVRGQIDEEGRLMVMTYDNLARLLEINQSGQKTTYEYYPAGTPKLVRSPASQRYWEYDALGRVILGREGQAQTTIKPDPAGNPRVFTDANGTVVTTEFNGLDLPTEVTIVHGKVPTTNDPKKNQMQSHLDGPLQENFRYDGLGRLVHADNGLTAVDRMYDGLGRLLSEGQGFRPTGQRTYDTHVVLTEYDTDLQRYQTLYPAIAGGSKITASLDSLGRVIRLQLDGRDLADYAYAGKDRMAWRRAGNFVDTFRQYDEERKNWRVTVSQIGDQLARWTSAFDTHTPVRVAEEKRTADGKQFHIMEALLDRQHRPTLTRTYGFTRLDNPPQPGVFERARAFLTGVKAGGADQVDTLLTETLRQYDDAGRVSRIAEVSYDEINNALGQLRMDTFGYDPAGRVGSTVTRLSQNIQQGPGGLAQLLQSALLNGKAVVNAARAAFVNDPLILAASPAGAVAKNFGKGLRQAVAENEPSQPAFTESQVFNTTVERAFGDVEALLKVPSFEPETQSFRYDANGNLVEDGRYLYAYDHQNRLTRIQDTFARSGNAFYSVEFVYDPLGRRVYQEYDPKLTGDGLTNLRYFYDGGRLIAEVVVDENRQNPSLLARYFYGAGDQELLRMDRRVNEQLGGGFAIHYLHDGIQEEVSFTSGNFGVAKATPVDFADEGVVRGDRVIQKTTTRLPYSAPSTRYEPMSGLSCQETTGTCLFDFRSAPKTEFQVERKEFQDKLLAQTKALQSEVLAVMAIELAPFLPVTGGSGLFATSAPVWGGGLVGVGLDYGMNKLMGHDYSLDQAVLAFGMGALSGGFGYGMTAVHGPASKLAFALGVGLDVGAGTAIDMLAYGQSFQDALVTNLIFNLASASLGRAAGRLGEAEIQTTKISPSASRNVGARHAPVMMQAAAAGPGGSAPGGPRELIATSSGKVADARKVVNARRLKGADLQFHQQVVQHLKGSDVGRKALAYIEKGVLKLKYAEDLRQDGKPMGGIYKSGGGSRSIYVNLNKDDALFTASLIVHEFEHALGGSELDAYMKQALFLADIAGLEGDYRPLRAFKLWIDRSLDLGIEIDEVLKFANNTRRPAIGPSAKLAAGWIKTLHSFYWHGYTEKQMRTPGVSFFAVTPFREIMAIQ